MVIRSILPALTGNVKDKHLFLAKCQNVLIEFKTQIYKVKPHLHKLQIFGFHKTLQGINCSYVCLIWDCIEVDELGLYVVSMYGSMSLCV